MCGREDTGANRIWIRGNKAPHLCSKGERALTALERDNVKEVRVGCRQGGCGACRIRVVSGEYDTGKMSRAHVSEKEEREGYALCCRLVPKTDLVLEPAFRGPSNSRQTAE